MMDSQQISPFKKYALFPKFKQQSLEIARTEEKYSEKKGKKIRKVVDKFLANPLGVHTANALL
jgi:hypothetical protein